MSKPEKSNLRRSKDRQQSNIGRGSNRRWMKVQWQVMGCKLADFDFGRRSVPLEPIQEVEIHEQRLGLVKRLSMMRIMARRTKAATVLA